MHDFYHNQAALGSITMEERQVMSGSGGGGSRGLISANVMEVEVD